MAHISNDGGKKLLARVRRIRGQIAGIERAIEEGNDCYAVLQQTAAARGALGGLMAELIDKAGILPTELLPLNRQLKCRTNSNLRATLKSASLRIQDSSTDYRLPHLPIRYSTITRQYGLKTDTKICGDFSRGNGICSS